MVFPCAIPGFFARTFGSPTLLERRSKAASGTLRTASAAKASSSSMALVLALSTEVDGGVLIAQGDDSIFLAGVALEELTARDFLFG